MNLCDNLHKHCGLSSIVFLAKPGFPKPDFLWVLYMTNGFVVRDAEKSLKWGVNFWKGFHVRKIIALNLTQHIGQNVVRYNVNQINILLGFFFLLLLLIIFIEATKKNQ